MISIIVTSRVQGNINHDLPELMRSLIEHSREPEDLELLVKFDIDDDEAYELSKTISIRAFPFEVKMARGERGRGYIDIHHGYNQLLPIMNPATNIVIAMADDFRAERDWDNALRNAAQGAGDYFILHQRPHPRKHWPKITGTTKDNYNAEPKFLMQDNMFLSENLYIIDEAPAWSPALLKACVCPMAVPDPFVFPVSFTDAWTICLEYVLWHEHGINISRFMPEIFINRKTCEVDQPGNPRWSTDRKINFDYIKSPEFRGIIEYQAKEIACQIQAKV